MAELAGKRIVVIGGSSGIGFGVATAALAAGAEVIIASRRQSQVDEACAALGAGASGQALDVSDEAAVAAFFAHVGAFDHLVYSAGDWTTAGSGAIASLDLDAARAVFDIRFWGALACVKHALGTLAADGSITLTDGSMAHRPVNGRAVTSAMLGAVEHLARSLAVDLAPIRVNAVCPGAIATPAWDFIPADQRASRIAQMTARTPLPRMGEPAEIALTYLHLMQATYTTGQVLRVDGGLSLV
ncbi:MAG TPA: SDR family oxidoreductase [Polymorphobacter sp.]|nr:SDR family oxidoreductase [Polymorphobacter sp.]